jgi:hypothetical protein
VPISAPLPNDVPMPASACFACQLFVALAEEGWTHGAVARATAERYLGLWFASDAARRLAGESGRAIPSRPDILVLGCTHFPVLRPGHTRGDRRAGDHRGFRGHHGARGLLRRHGAAPGTAALLRFLATDGAARLRPLAAASWGTKS